ncbi:hypothetical protein N7462_009776 [Penicillium macrosclerotiorum]|uniref:uncharacterized protein n=1 Tax=Penicillium macrosclerotiorum TaxID=303699 RepID=UPI0025484832|nr:uncharacterized protein N7462_009776 [Penicillium macrosclerotiorum]KAJ5668706.1 hypothetical protein N7462_009776 [Penicillium macrosclerotiorum]
MSDHIDVLLYGLGAIGSFYAFILSRSERVRLTVVARSNYDAVVKNVRSLCPINYTGNISADLEIRELLSTARTMALTSSVPTEVYYAEFLVFEAPEAEYTSTVIKTPAEASAMDYVVCAHKAIDQEDVATKLQPVVDQKRTTIVIIQNGVGNEEAFRKTFPESSILTCVTWVGATQISPGVVKHTKSEDMQIGLFPNPEVAPSKEQQRLDTFAGLLEHGQTRFQVLDDMQRQRWEKVVWNVAWNSITTITMLDTQTWLHSSIEAEPITRKVMRQVINVARASGVPLEDSLVDQLMDKINSMPGIGSSMQTDCKNGRPMEVDVILGFPMRKAREFGVPADSLEMLYALVLAQDHKIRASL